LEGRFALLGTNFDPRNSFWRYRDHEIRFVSEPLLKKNPERPEAPADRAPISNLEWGFSRTTLLRALKTRLPVCINHCSSSWN
jgi:hypothetical protein